MMKKPRYYKNIYDYVMERFEQGKRTMDIIREMWEEIQELKEYLERNEDDGK